MRDLPLIGRDKSSEPPPLFHPNPRDVMHHCLAVLWIPERERNMLGVVWWWAFQDVFFCELMAVWKIGVSHEYQMLVTIDVNTHIYICKCAWMDMYMNKDRLCTVPSCITHMWVFVYQSFRIFVVCRFMSMLLCMSIYIFDIYIYMCIYMHLNRRMHIFTHEILHCTSQTFICCRDKQIGLLGWNPGCKVLASWQVSVLH